MHLPTILGLWLHEVYILITEPDKHIKVRKRSRQLQNVISATKEPYKVLKQGTLGAISFRYSGGYFIPFEEVEFKFGPKR